MPSSDRFTLGAARMQTMMRFAIALTIALFLAAAPGWSATYHVDAINGDDVSGDASAQAPLRTLAAVRPVLVGGDTVVLYDGSYGVIEEVQGAVADLHDDWVTYEAAPGTAPQIGHVRFGRNGGSYIGPQDQAGAYNVYLRLVGLHITDGVLSYGARHWALIACVVEREGPWVGSAADIEKTAVAWHAGTDILIEDCEVTNTGTAIAGRGHDVRIIGNHIHGGTHDGLRVAGFRNSIVEGNVIHDFDDGVTDDEAEWSRHCDGIHIVVPDPETPGRQNHNVIFRNNVVYDVEGQVVRFGNAGRLQRNEMMVFENNVFGPGHGTMFNVAAPCDTLIFRHNTVVHVPGGRPYNRWLCNNVTLRVSAGSRDVEIYNNILGSTEIDPGADIRVLDWNLVQVPGNPVGAGDARAHGRFTILGGSAGFVDPAEMDYRVWADSPAVDAGTELFAPDPLYESDYEGTRRDSRPDMGAYELPGRAPPPEEPLREFPGPKHIFVDDFEDGHTADVDPWLEGPGQQGLSWHLTGLPDKYYVTNGTLLERNALWEPVGRSGEQRVAWILSDQGPDWVDYAFEFTARNSYLATGGGPVVLAVDQRNCYWIDIASNAGRLIRTTTDPGGRVTKTVLAEKPAVALPLDGARRYRVSVAHDPAGVTIEVDAGADGSVDLSCRDTDPRAVEVFGQGGIGFHGEAPDPYGRIAYDNVSVTVNAFYGEPETLQIVRWDLVENHGTAGEMAIATQDGYVASTLHGIRKLRVTFSRPLNPATVGKAAVSVLGQLGGPQSHLVSSVSLDTDNTVLTILLSSPLPDEDRYVLTLAGTVTGAGGAALAGTRDRILSTLAGDAGGSGQVSFGDMAVVRDKVGAAVTPQTARYDIDGSGSITALDMLCVRGLDGHLLP